MAHPSRFVVLLALLVRFSTTVPSAENTYRNRNSVEQALGRSILASRDAIILVPREPLRAGSRYHVHVEVSGRAIDWTFTVGG